MRLKNKPINKQVTNVKKICVNILCLYNRLLRKAMIKPVKANKKALTPKKLMERISSKNPQLKPTNKPKLKP
jgi:hypothetical protein